MIFLTCLESVCKKAAFSIELHERNRRENNALKECFNLKCAAANPRFDSKSDDLISVSI